MDAKLKAKAKKIIGAVAANTRSSTSPAACEAIGYVLAYATPLPSSPISQGYLQNSMEEALLMCSYIGEETMHLPTEIMKHAYYWYEIRHDAAFSSLKFAAKVRKEIEFDCDDTPMLIRDIISETAKGESGTVQETAAVRAI